MCDLGLQVLTNSQLHRVPDVDDSMSGTTAIAMLLRGRTVYVANVGDSRCVLAERTGDKLVAQDLSFDQTPFRYASSMLLVVVGFSSHMPHFALAQA